MSDLSGVTLSWRGVTFVADPAADFELLTLDGWEGLPDDVADTAQARPHAHGTFDGDVLAGARVVTATGICKTPATRDADLAVMGATMALSRPGARLEDLTVSFAGRELTARARLVRYRPDIDLWGAGSFQWKAQWRCPDPLRYGARVSASTPFPELVGGLEYDLYTDGDGTDLGYLDYGEAPTFGRLTLTNTGAADAALQHEVTGEIDGDGFEIVQVDGPGRLVFAGAVPSASRLVIDGATGAVLIDGVADRAGQLTDRTWPVAGPGESIVLAFIRRGSAAGGNPTLTSSLAPAYW